MPLPRRNYIREQIDREEWPDVLPLDPEAERAQGLERLRCECAMWRAIAVVLGAALVALSGYVVLGGR